MEIRSGAILLIVLRCSLPQDWLINVHFVCYVRAIGYRDISTHATIINPNIPRGLSIHDSQEKAFAKPDFSQMIPFKPKSKYIPGEHPIPGGSFPPPPAVSNLLSILPPPSCFRGPFVKVDKLIDLILKINLPEEGEVTGDVYFFISD